MSTFSRIDTSSSDEEGSNGRAVQLSDANSSSTSSSLPGALHSNVNAEILRRMLSPGHPNPTPMALPAAESNNALLGNVMALLCSQRDSQPAFSSAPAVNTASQLWGANGATTTIYPRPTTQLSPGDLHMMALMRAGDASLSAPRSIPNKTMPTMEQHLNVLVQQQRAEQAIAALASINAASRSPLIHLAEPQQYPSPSLELLQYLAQGRKRDRVMPSDTLLQAQACAGHQASNFSFGNLAGDRATQPSSSEAPAMTPIPIPPPYGRNGEAESFPGKLYRLLAEVEREGNTHIVSFTPDEKAFMIHDRDAFMNDVAPKYFRQSRFTSFVRQLNLYGFGRLSYGPNRGAFAHSHFLRGRPELVGEIQRSHQDRKIREWASHGRKDGIVSTSLHLKK
jgi:hypothetical protein